MILYIFRCGCGYPEWRGSVSQGHCPGCGSVNGWSGMVQTDSGTDYLADRRQTGYKIAPDLSPQQQAHIESPEVQAKLKSGEYAPIQKGSDEWNHAH